MQLKPLALSFAVACAPAVQAAEWDYPSAAVMVTDEAEAKTYLDANYADTGKFKFRYKTESQLGEHYNFDVWVNGQYQAQRTVVVTTDKGHRVVRVFKSLEDTVIRNGKPTVAAEIELPRELDADEPPALSTGSLVDVSVSLFNPDLRTMQRQPAPELTWTSVADYPQPLEYVTKTIQVLRSGGKLYLSNERLKQVDAHALLAVAEPGGEPEHDTSNVLTPEGIPSFASTEEMQNIRLGDEAFPQLMAYYHLDHSLQYLSSLTYDLFEQPLRFDGRGLAKDNSSYYLGPRAVLFGIGGASADALDADVILHELGHGIHYQIVPDWAYGHTGAIGEGVGDYWAGSASYRTQYLDAARCGQEFELDTVFNWDGLFGVRRSTRSLWNQRARYFEGAEYRAHESVGGELGDELWSTPLFQALKASVERYGDGTDRVFREFDAIVLEGMYGVGRGVKMHDLAESTVFAAATLFPAKDYAQLLTDSFSQHKLLKAPFHVRYDARYIAPGESVGVTLTPNGRDAIIKGQWQLNQAAVVAIDETLSGSTSMEAALPNELTCGAPFDSIVALDYQFGEGLKLHRWRENVKLVNGTPKLQLPAEALNASLPDSATDNLGRPTQGDKIFVQTLSDRSLKIDDSFAVYLNIEHPSLQDLQVTLISPQGQSVVLLNHQSSNHNGFQGYFTAQYDDELQPLIGEPSWGTWRLEISDRVSGHSGELKEWRVSHYSDYQCRADSMNQSQAGGLGGSSSPIALFGLLLLSMVRVTRSR
ncbi:proprotein convertase P-domain-containing protein [Vibrio sp. CAU 1672]|uniref:proprotein convertase P-domain-containing protein n=1 Tax=Vibrio sp. CAU 1672 TaxID=3032594 RepID=UPI0023DC5CCD|nr:proprotein convertase P-domain-containing protein [Vibrio sp. CAU 1672]MDF2152677.1 proprotein convertase P-domain-containing protein [Vibrio sp. CAU 1672]